jgi:MoxR-like ATPase
MDDVLRTAQFEVRKAVIGHDTAVEWMLIAVLARGHMLLEGPPGSAKTLLARSIARLIGGHFRRVQMTIDTQPAEITGETYMSGGQDVFRKGPIFTNVFLADEINRAAAHTQASLLEAMQERHVSSSGKTHWIESPFTVIATQNPFEHQGVFPLPESQLDRFIVKVPVGYPNPQQELEVLELPHRGTTTEVIGEINPILASGALLQEQERVDAVPVPTDIARAIVEMIQYTRTASGVEMGASSRAGVHLYAASKARAYLHDHVAVTDEDVRAIAPLVLTHRMWAEDPAALVHDALRYAFGHSEALTQ